MDIINSSNDHYTTSSCAGRIQLISLPKLGDKKNSVVLGKWHDPIELAELKGAISDWDGTNFIMLLVQSPVVHVVCRTLETASVLRNLADGSGFKYSTIRSIHTSMSADGEKQNITVELLSTERMDIPLGINGTLFPTDDYLGFIIDLARKSLERSRAKLDRLENNLKNHFEK